MLKKIIFRHIWVYALFFLLHIVFFNINVSEWGDSYRFLRAGEFIRRGDYPVDEKRPPFFSSVLATRPDVIPALIWGKVVVFALSFASLIVFNLLLTKYVTDKTLHAFALLCFALNPVYFYWSLRVYSDILFVFLVLLAFYIYSFKTVKYREPMLGILCGLAVLTRFEGYLLLAAFAIELYFSKKQKPLLHLLASASLLIIPFIIWRNPLFSTYFFEPTKREFDLDTIWAYMSSLVFLFGFFPAWLLLWNGRNGIKKLILANKTPAIFIAMELLLAFIWPAAIPRLFLPVLPFLIIALVLSIEEKGLKMPLTHAVIWFIALSGFWFLTQKYNPQQFLVPYKTVMLALWFIQLAMFVAMQLGNKFFFKFFVIVSISAWAFVSVWVHKDTLKSVTHAAQYAADNLNGRFVYNDASSVSGWYLNYNKPRPNLFGFFFDIGNPANLAFNMLLLQDPDYLLVTNEHNVGLELNFAKRPYLEEIRDFRYNINGVTFFTTILKFNKDYYNENI